jgi:hypothetical protein
VQALLGRPSVGASQTGWGWGRSSEKIIPDLGRSFWEYLAQWLLPAELGKKVIGNLFSPRISTTD